MDMKLQKYNKIKYTSHSGQLFEACNTERPPSFRGRHNNNFSFDMYFFGSQLLQKLNQIFAGGHHKSGHVSDLTQNNKKIFCKIYIINFCKLEIENSFLLATGFVL